MQGINCNLSLSRLFSVKVCLVFLLNLGDLWGHINVVKRISKTRLWLYLTLVTGRREKSQVNSFLDRRLTTIALDNYCFVFSPQYWSHIEIDNLFSPPSSEVRYRWLIFYSNDSSVKKGMRLMVMMGIWNKPANTTGHNGQLMDFNEQTLVSSAQLLSLEERSFLFGLEVFRKLSSWPPSDPFPPIFGIKH